MMMDRSRFLAVLAERTMFSPTSHLSRRALLKGLLVTAGGSAVMNWGSLTGLAAVAEEVKRKRAP